MKIWFFTPPVNWLQWKKTGLAYLSLALGILMFSGVLAHIPYWNALDFVKLKGQFGQLATTDPLKTVHFRGIGGTGALDGFLFSFSLIPVVMFSLAVLKCLERAGAIHAAKQLLSPICYVLLGMSGAASLAMVSSLQSADAGATATLELYRKGLIQEEDRYILGMFQLSGGGLLTNFFATGGILLDLPLNKNFPTVGAYTGRLLAIIFLMKFFGAFCLRVYLHILSSANRGLRQRGK